MSAKHPEAGRRPQAASRARRHYEIRRLNAAENPKANPGHLALVWSDGGANLGLEAAAVFNEGILVDGFERIHLAVDVDFGDVGNNMTTVFIAAQASANGNSDDVHWFDVFSDEGGAGVLVRKVWELTLNTGANAETKGVWIDQRRALRYMRFKVWVDGATFTDSRATLHAIRVMDAA